MLQNTFLLLCLQSLCSIIHFLVVMLIFLVISECLGSNPSNIQGTTEFVYQLILHKYDTT